MAKLTKLFIDNYTLPVNKERVDVFDSELKGYGIRISKTKKIFFVMKYMGTKRVRVTIGPYPVFTAEAARKQAMEHIGDMSRGIDPNQKKKESRVKGITVGELYKQYVEDKSLKDSTKRTVKDLMENHLGDWLDKPISQLNAQMILQRHKYITENVGAPTANNAMRTLRAQFNYWKHASEGKYTDNPVTALSAMGKWNKSKPRKTYIPPHQLPDWFEAVNALDNPTMRDYLFLLLFTGLRKKEGQTMEWKNVNFHAKTFTVADTKNGKDHTLPMSQFLYDLLKARHEECGKNTYVFPGEGQGGFLAEPKRAVQSVRDTSNTDFCLHDLRRTFITIASDLVTPVILKHLANHSLGKDVTEGYIVVTLEKLRAPMEMISQTILDLATPTQAQQ